MMQSYSALFCSFFIFLSAFAEAPQMHKSTVPVPPEIFELIQKDFAIHSLDFSHDFFDIEVFIRSTKSEQKLRLGYTQEVLDLSSYVDKIWPEFTIGFLPPFELDSNTSLYFINRYKPTEVGRQKIGIECGKAVKIQKQLKELFSTRGIKLMTKAGHYLNLLGGDYLLVKKEGQKIRIGYFKIRDGRWSHRLCNMSL